MSSIIDIKVKNIIEKKPYITKGELGLLFNCKERNLDKKILTMVKNGYLVNLKRGLYTTQAYVSTYLPLVLEYLTNSMYYPSYISSEYVLQKEGMLPEQVYTVTSVTNKNSRMFNNALGNFLYRSIRDDLFCGYTQYDFREDYKIKIATKAKALFDYLYFKNVGRTKKVFTRELFFDLRLNWSLFSQKDIQEFGIYTKLSGSKKMSSIYQLIKKNHDNQSA